MPLDPRIEKERLARMIELAAPLRLMIGGRVYKCVRTPLQADLAASLYGFEDRYSTSVTLVTPCEIPAKNARVTLQGREYVIIGMAFSSGDVSLRLDLRENF